MVERLGSGTMGLHVNRRSQSLISLLLIYLGEKRGHINPGQREEKREERGSPEPEVIPHLHVKYRGRNKYPLVKKIKYFSFK